MFFSPTFRLSDLTLQELKHAGLRDEVVKVLQSKRAKGAVDKPRMLALLNGVAKLEPDEAQLILKMSRQSLLRLERVIPNRAVREWADALIFAFVIAMIVRSFIFAPFKIPSASMVPTINVGDHIFATMYSYGLHIPLTNIRLFGQSPERGDIVIFPYPNDPSVDYIKRVIAKGGETVEVRGKEVLVNGKVLDEPYANFDPVKLAAFGAKCEGAPFCGPFTVKPGHLFVMGDNRLDSADSRFWGTVDETTVKGRGRIIYWSHDPDAGLFGGYRFGRIGSLLH
jgi:signal peptidase I